MYRTPTPPILAWTTSRCGFEAGSLLGQYALRKWKGKVDCVLGVGFSEAGSFVQSRITGAFDGIRERLSGIAADCFIQLEGRGMRQPSEVAVAGFLKSRRKGEHVLVAAATDSAHWACWMPPARLAAKTTSPS